MGRTRAARTVGGFAAAALASLLVLPAPARAGPPDARRFRSIHVVDFEGEIEPVLAAYLGRSLDAARAARADCVVLRVDSPGGRLDSMERIVDALLEMPRTVRTVAWVPEGAYSAAAIAALACDEVVMAPGARVGDAQPILLTPEGFEPAGEKIETVARALVRRIAERNGWDPLLSEKLVSADREVLVVRRRSDGRELFVDGPEFEAAREGDLVGGVLKEDLSRVRVAVPKGRLLTMTAAEARAFGFVHRVLEREEDLLAALSADGASVARVAMTWRERATRWLFGLVGVLGALLSLCIVLTVFQGIGVATFVGIGALLLIGLVTTTAELANGFSFFLVGLGVVLLLVEVLLVPGFGVPGVVGIVAVGAGFLSLATGFTPTDRGALTWESAAAFVGQFAATLLVAGAGLLLLSRATPSLPFLRRHLHLPAGALPAGAAVVPGDVVPAAGAEGVAATALRPSGRATIAGRPVDVVSEGGFVDAGERVRVMRVEGARVVVRPLPPAEGRA